jgi:hypothetical protein
MAASESPRIMWVGRNISLLLLLKRFQSVRLFSAREPELGTLVRRVNAWPETEEYFKMLKVFDITAAAL